MENTVHCGKNFTYTYFDNTGITDVKKRYKDQIFTSYAECHPDDSDFASEKTGCQIAELRADIKIFQYIIRQLKLELKTLINFQKVLNNCKQTNLDSFEYKRLQKEINLKTKKIEEVKNNLKDTKEYLKKYIELKDKLYRKLEKGHK